MSDPTLLALITLVLLTYLGAIVYYTCQWMRKVADHREAQAMSVLKHAGFVSTPTEDDE